MRGYREVEGWGINVLNYWLRLGTLEKLLLREEKAKDYILLFNCR